MKPVLAAFLGGLLCAGTLPAYTQTPAPRGSPCAPRPTLFSISDRDPLNPSILYVCAADSEQEVPGFIYVEADEDPFPMSFEELKAAGLVIQKVDASAESITFVYGGRSQTLSADAPEGLDSLESLVPWLRERRQSLAAQAAEKEKEKIQQAQGAAQKIPNPFSGNPLKKTAPESVAVPSILPTQILPAPAQKSPEEEIREIDIEKLAEVLDQIRTNDPKKLPIDQAQTLLKIHEDLEQGLQNLEGERLELANRRQQSRQPILQLLQEAQKARQGAEEKKREADKLKGEEKRRLQEEAEALEDLAQEKEREARKLQKELERGQNSKESEGAAKASRRQYAKLLELKGQAESYLAEVPDEIKKRAPIELAERPVFRTEATLVRVPVHPLTPQGSTYLPLENWRAEDFEIKESGTRQEIAGMDAGKGPVLFGIVLDMSGSMQESSVPPIYDPDGRILPNWARAMEMVQGLLENLRTDGIQGDKFFVVGFHRQVFLIQDWTSDLGRVDMAIKSNAALEMQKSEMTALKDAVLFSLEYLKNYTQVKNPEELPDRKALIVITDGQTNADVQPRVDERIRDQAQEGDVLIYLVGLQGQERTCRDSCSGRTGPCSAFTGGPAGGGPTLNTGPLRGGMDPSQQCFVLPQESAWGYSTLSDLAKKTGGRALLENFWSPRLGTIHLEDRTTVVPNQMQGRWYLGFLNEIHRDLRNYLLLYYRPTDLRKNGKWREIEVRLRPEKIEQEKRLRESYADTMEDYRKNLGRLQMAWDWTEAEWARNSQTIQKEMALYEFYIRAFQAGPEAKPDLTRWIEENIPDPNLRPEYLQGLENAFQLSEKERAEKSRKALEKLGEARAKMEEFQQLHATWRELKAKAQTVGEEQVKKEFQEKMVEWQLKAEKYARWLGGIEVESKTGYYAPVK